MDKINNTFKMRMIIMKCEAEETRLMLWDTNPEILACYDGIGIQAILT